MTSRGQHNTATLSWLEKSVSLFARVHPGEGRGMVYLFLNFFLLLLAYYLLKPVREALVLSENGAEVRSYALAAQSVLLLFLIPLYGMLFRRLSRQALMRGVVAFFVLTLLLFCLLDYWEYRVGVFFFIWLGIFSVTLVAQFWAFAVDIYSAEAGYRLFAFISVGATLGALLGSETAKLLFALIGVNGLMLLGALILATTLRVSDLAERYATPLSRKHPSRKPAPLSLEGGFSIVMKDRYLLMIALIVLILSCVNSTGEYIFARMVVERAGDLVDAQVEVIDKSEVIGAIYGNYYFWVNLLTLVTQLLLVHRLWRWIGVRGALLISPLIAGLGYGLIAFLPIFSVIQLIKIIENAADYSTQNTSRHALFFHVSRQKKYQGQTCIDTLFCRLGDLLQAAVVFAGTHWLDFGVADFAWLNAILAVFWILAALAVGRLQKRLEQNAYHRAPATD